VRRIFQSMAGIVAVDASRHHTRPPSRGAGTTQ